MQDNLISERRCTVCGEIKPLSNFYKLGGNRFGYRAKCKACHNAEGCAYYLTVKDSEEFKRRQKKHNIEYRADPANRKRIAEKAHEWWIRNRERQQAKAREKYQTNPDYRQRVRAWHKANGYRYREKRNQYSLAYRALNKERVDGYKKKWRRNNQGKVRAIGRAWERKNPDLVSVKKRNRVSRERGASGKYTIRQWRSLLRKYGNRCLACNTHADDTPEKRLTADHIVPIVMGGSNLIENIQPLCQSCNSRKGARSCTDYRGESPRDASGIQLVLGLPVKQDRRGRKPNPDRHKLKLLREARRKQSS